MTSERSLDLAQVTVRFESEATPALPIDVRLQLHCASPVGRRTYVQEPVLRRMHNK